MIDKRFVGDVNLPALDLRRNRNDDGEVAGVALEIVGHRHDGPILIADDYDLRRAVENLRVALRDVEAAKRVRLCGNEQRGDENEAAFEHDCLLKLRLRVGDDAELPARLRDATGSASPEEAHR